MVPQVYFNKRKDGCFSDRLYRAILIVGFLVGSASCSIQPNVHVNRLPNGKAVQSYGNQIEGDPDQSVVYVPTEEKDNGTIKARLEPSDTKTQIVRSTSSQTVFATTEVAFPPGSLAVGVDLKIEQGQDLLAGSRFSSLASSKKEQVLAGITTKVTSDQLGETKLPFSLSLPMQTELQLVESQSTRHVLLFLKAGASNSEDTVQLRFSVNPDKPNTLIVKWKEFGEFQLLTIKKRQQVELLPEPVVEEPEPEPEVVEEEVEIIQPEEEPEQPAMLALSTLTVIKGTQSMEVPYGGSQSIDFTIRNDGNKQSGILEFEQPKTPWQLLQQDCPEFLEPGEACIASFQVLHDPDKELILPDLKAVLKQDQQRVFFEVSPKVMGAPPLVVGPMFPTHGQHWLDYVTQDGSGYQGAADQECKQALVQNRDSCLHAGPLKVSMLPEKEKCADLKIYDLKGLLNWKCRQKSEGTEVYSVSLNQGKSLRDMITIEGVSENTLLVEKNGKIHYSSKPGVWWKNPVEIIKPDPKAATAMQLLTVPYTIYIHTSEDPIKGYRLQANKTALVTLGHDQIKASEGNEPNCHPNPLNASGPYTLRCLVSVEKTAFNWIEARIDAASFKTGHPVRNAAVKVFGVDYLTIRDSRIQNVAAGHGLNISHSKIIDLVNSRLDQVRNDGIKFDQASDLLVYGSTISNTGESGIDTAEASNIRVIGTTIAYNSFHGTLASKIGGLVYQANTAHATNLRSINIYNSSASVFAGSIFSNNTNHGMRIQNTSGFDFFSSSFVGNGAGSLGINSSSNLSFKGSFHFSNECELGSFLTNVGISQESCNPGTDSTYSKKNWFGDIKTSLVGSEINADLENIHFGVKTVTSGDLIEDWGTFESPFRTVRRGGTEDFNTAAERRRCENTTECGIADFRLRLSDTKLLDANGQAPESLEGKKVCPAVFSDQLLAQIPYAGTSRFTPYAYEILSDGIGNDNGLCESGESCIFQRNIGSYQGHGALEELCEYNSDSSETGLTGVKIYQYSENGIEVKNFADPALAGGESTIDSSVP